MIGLGSNRLTVCRRGGMSVTQAGRGGMEWLAGGRMPSWASPYSAQATAALQAQFPTQWPTIRDYGFAHPEIVGYMNAYAPEDAKIAYSLVEGIGTRWIVKTGTAWFNTEYTPLAFPLNLKFKWVWSSHGGEKDFFGNFNGSHGTSEIFVSGGNGNSWYQWAGSAWSFGSIADGTVYVGEFEYTAATGRKAIINGTTYTSTQSNNSICRNPNEPIGLFSGAGTRDYAGATGKMAYAKITCGGELVREMYPFIRKINGVDTLGMIDVKNGVFYQKQGTGTFTELIESPS